MRHLHLAITQPCHEDWNSMTGSEKQRHCSQCDKHVVALAEMTPDEAETLVRESKPHSLCLRIEHDDAGTILFRKRAPQAMSNRAMPLLTLAMGASLFAVACDHPAAPSATHDSAKADSTESVEPLPAVGNEPTPLGDSSQLPIAEKVPQPEAQSATGVDEKSTIGANARPAKMNNGAKPRITTGCVCAVGDRLCDCL